jgi:hypothetical protein
MKYCVMSMSNYAGRLSLGACGLMFSFYVGGGMWAESEYLCDFLV